MSDSQTFSIGADIAPLNSALADAATALSNFANGPVANTASQIQSAVDKSFNSVAHSIADAATSGKTSIDKMVDAILADFDRVAIGKFIVKPIEGLVSSLASSAIDSVIGGARAAGGPVDAGTSYLVGENGPEVFTPAQGGSIAPNSALRASGASVTLNVNTRDATSFAKSESQIAAMMMRALARGQRNL